MFTVLCNNNKNKCQLIVTFYKVIIPIFVRITHRFINGKDHKKGTHPGLTADHIEKEDGLPEIVKNITLRRRRFEKVEYIQTYQK